MAKLLIVDDRVLNRQFLRTLLGYAGHQISEAADGAEALVKVRAERPDLVITDLLMPTMDGFQLVQHIRAERAIAATNVIFYTATYRLREADRLAQACDVSVVIPKPSDPQLIVDTVNAVLDKTKPPPVGTAGLLAVADEASDSDLKVKLANYLLNLKQMSSQIIELGEAGADLARREATALDLSERLREALTHLQTVSLKLASLLELGMELTAHRDPDQLLEIFCRATVRVIGARYCVLAIVSDDTERLAYFKCHADNNDELPGVLPVSPRAGILGSLLDNPQPRRLTNPRGDPRDFGLSPSHPPVHSFLGIPVVSSKQVYGWFYLVDKIDAAEFRESDEQLAATLAAQLAVSYRAVCLYDEVQRHAANLELEAHRRKLAEEKFYSAIQAAPNGMLMVDGAGKVELANAQIVELFGYQAEELIGHPVEILLPECNREAHVNYRASFMLNPQTRNMGAGRDLHGRHKDGREFPVEIGLNPLATNDGLKILASVIDITERKHAEDTIRERMRAAEFTAAVSAALAGKNSLRSMTQDCTAAMVRHLDAAFARIWVLNTRENILELAASAGMYTHIDGAHGRIPVGQFKIGLIAQERRPHMTNAVIGDPRVHDQEWAKKEGMVSFAGYPLILDNRVVGVMAMFGRQPISPSILEMLGTVANEIAVGIERKLSEERERQQTERIRALHEIDRAITSTLDLPSVLSVVMKSVEQFFPGATGVGVALLNHDTGLLEPVAMRGIPLDEWKRAFFDTEPSFIDIDALNGPLFIRDLPASTRHHPRQRAFVDKYSHASLLVAPIRIENRPLGLLGFATKVRCDFSETERDFFVTLAGQAAVAIQNAKLYERIKGQALDLAEQERIQRVLKELSQDITAMNAHELLEKLMANIRDIFKVDVADVRFLGEGRWENILISSDEGAQWLPGGGEFGKGANLLVVTRRRSLTVRDTSEQTEFPPGRVTKEYGIRGFLASPLISKKGDVIGVIRALSKNPREFSAREIDLFEQLASGAAIAIENEQLYSHLQKSDNVKSEFLSVISHELRTPLNIIMGYVSVLKDGARSQSDAPENKAVQVIERQTNGLMALINSIMDATGLQSGSLGVNKREIHIDQLFEQLKSVCEAARKAETAVIWDLPDGLPSLTTDHEKLLRILQNLIDNALKFTDSGTIRISARADADAASGQSYVEFKVSDTGVGIAEQDLPYVFEMFRQADSSTTRPFEGVGLGLYVAKRFTDLIGGKLTVESTVGKGSTFILAIRA